MSGYIRGLQVNWQWYLFVISTVTSNLLSAWIGLANWHDIHTTLRGKLFIITCIILIIAFILQNNKQTRDENLHNKLQEAENKLKIYSKIDPHKILSHILMGIANEKLRLGSDDRISIYQITNNGFILRGRYSDNPALLAAGRSIYPLGQGCIGLTHEQGTFQKLNLPDPNAHNTKYYSVLEDEYAIPQTTSRAFRMKSRSIVGLRIKTLDQSESIGVIVVESTRARGIDPIITFDYLKQEISTFSALLAGFKEELTIKRPSDLEGAF